MYIWEAAIGEELNCKWEPSNSLDRYAMAAVKDDIHLSVTYRKKAGTHLFAVPTEGWCDVIPSSREEEILFQPVKCSMVKFSPLEVKGEIGENFPTAKYPAIWYYNKANM